MRLRTKRLTVNLLMYTLIAAITGAIVYLRMDACMQSELTQQERVSNNEIENYRGHINELSHYIASLKSRVKHLASDNKRLSEKGSQLIASLEGQNAHKDAQRLLFANQQEELTKLDTSIMDKYVSYIAKQEISNELKIACKKGSSKSKKCEEYQDSVELLDSIASQIKYLRAKRDVSLAELERSAAGL